MKLTNLYKKDASGNMLGWRIWTEANCVFTRHGRLDGSIQQDMYEVLEGTNIGRSNQRDEIEQAEFEAESKWKKQVKYKGYFESIQAANEAGDNTYFGALKPMKAQRHDKHAHKLFYPLYVQPKLNGLRCMATMYQGTVKLYRSGGQMIKHFEHIRCDLLKIMKNGDIFDGELYDHGTPLSVISGIVRADVNVKSKEVQEKIKFWIFDAPKIGVHDIENTFFTRFDELYKRFNNYQGEHLILVGTTAVDSDKLSEAMYVDFVHDGYEGMMYRLMNMSYKPGKRSYEIQKRKDFQEDDFQILYANEGKGRAKGMAVSFTCTKFSNELGEDATFEVPMNGTDEYRIMLWNSPESFRGKWLQTRYLNLSVYGIPEIPKGLQIRDTKGLD
jgi:DNA ligase 1